MPDSIARSPARLFLISFTILFIELAAIRWLNATVSVLAYFNNLILLSCFFGLGLGCVLATRRVDLIKYFAPAMLLLVVAVIYLQRHGFTISYTDDVILSANIEFFETGALRISLAALGGFLVNVGFFVILGQELGKQLSAVQPPLLAYSYDIAGSLLGVLAFGLMARMGTPPHVWYAIGAGLLLTYVVANRRGLILSAGLIVVAVVALKTTYSGAMWSPYYKVEYSTIDVGGEPLGFRIMVDNARIQDALDFGPALERSPLAPWVHYYELPYHFIRPKKVLILGAGSGNEVIPAIAYGADVIHAVEIDPVIALMGSGLHPETPYQDARVRIIVDDARSFISNTDERYDLIVMSALDSHKQVAGMSSLRLESFVYTVESFRRMRELLAPDGVFCLNLGSTRQWMGERTYASLTEAFGSEPTVFTSPNSPFASVAYVYASPERLATDLLPTRAPLQRLTPSGAPGQLRLATDNWPHLYLERNRVPTLYVAVLGTMMLLSILLVVGIEPQARRPSMHFFFLGAGFMLLETRSVTQMALLFGATWNVNTIVFASILLAIFLSNYLVLRGYAPSRRLSYILLIATLVLGYLFPFHVLLPLPLILKLALAGVAIGLPIVWASFVFSISFRGVTNISKAFSSNLLGIVFGGCLEYLSNIWGLNVLYVVALVVYLASAATVRPRELPTAAT